MRRLLPLLALCLPAVAGCQGTAFEKTLTLPKGSPYLEVEFKGPKREQSLAVTASAEVPLNVYLVLTDDKEEAVAALVKGKKPRKVVAAGEGDKEVKFEGKVAAGKGFAVLVRPAEPPGKELEVKVTVTGR